MKDLHKVHILAKGEIGFFKFIVCPLWELLNNFFEGQIQEGVDYLKNAV